MDIWILKNGMLARYSSNLNTMYERISDKVFPFLFFIFIRLFRKQSYSQLQVKVHTKL